MKTRRKDGKTHRYWTVVENRRCSGGRVVQRQVLHLGELNDAQRAGWVRAVDALGGDENQPRQLALFPEDRAGELPAPAGCEPVRVRLDGLSLENPRQWGACWLALGLWDALELDAFFGERLGVSRKGTRWLNVLKALVCHQLISGGSDFRFHREWFAASAMGDLLGEDFRLAQKDKPYRCLDKLLEHKEALFSHLAKKWTDLFGATYDLLLYDLTSTYFESNPPPPGSDSKKRFGYSRDHRPDCVQVVIALVVTPEGFPLAYEVLPGNTRDTATLDDFLQLIERRYGKARRTWLMDRGVPTEETLEKMRGRGIHYLVGTPKGKLTKMEKELAEKPWAKARETVRVKLIERDEEFYVYVQSEARVAKERSMRRRRLRLLWDTLADLRRRKRLTRDELLMALGAAKKQAGRAWKLVTVTVPAAGQAVDEKNFTFSIDRAALRRAWRREGRYLLRSNHLEQSPEAAWENYLLLVRVEQAFKDLKGDLSIRPIRHQKESRIEAHIFVCFLAYCLHTTLRNQARAQAPGLTPAAILEAAAKIQMIDVRLPTTDGREILLQRTTQPSPETALLMAQLKLILPPQPPPKILLKEAPEPKPL